MRNLMFVVITIIMLSSLLVSVSAEDVSSTLTVNETNIIKSSDRRVLGFNDDIDWRSTWRRSAGSASAVLNPDYFNTLKKNQFNIQILRGFFNKVDWKETIGNLDERGHNPINDGLYNFGMVEWIKSTLTVTNDAEFVIVVNLDDTVENIQDMVRFLTLNPDDPNAVGSDNINWAQRRIDLGINEPVKIACFELGNEVDMAFYSDMDNLVNGASWYIDVCKSMINGIKAINSNAKTSVLSYTESHNGLGQWGYWNQTVILALGEMTDYIVKHYYYHTAYGNMGYFLEKAQFDIQIATYINQLNIDKRPKIFLSEHAIWLDSEWARDETSDKKKTVSSLIGTLVSAEVVNRLCNRQDTELAIYHSLFGNSSDINYYGGHCWGVLRPYHNGELYLNGAGEMFKLMYDAFGKNIVESTLVGNSHDYCKDAIDWTESGGANRKILTVSAHATEDGGLNLIFVNSNQEIGHNITFSANNIYKIEKEVVLTSTDIMATNDPLTPEGLFGKTNQINSEEQFTGWYIPPQSVIALYLSPMDKQLFESNMEVKFDGFDVGGNGSNAFSDDFESYNTNEPLLVGNNIKLGNKWKSNQENMGYDNAAEFGIATDPTDGSNQVMKIQAKASEINYLEFPSLLSLGSQMDTSNIFNIQTDFYITDYQGGLFIRFMVHNSGRNYYELYFPNRYSENFNWVLNKVTDGNRVMLDSGKVDDKIFENNWYHLSLVVDKGEISWNILNKSNGSTMGEYTRNVIDTEPYKIGKIATLQLGAAGLSSAFILFDNFKVVQMYENGKVGLDCVLYNNKNMSNTDELSLMVLKPGSDYQNVEVNDIVNIMQESVLKQRGHFDFTMPEDAEKGLYTVCILNKKYGTDCYKKLQFDYVQFSKSKKINKVDILSSENDTVRNIDYKVDIKISFDKSFADNKQFTVKVVNKTTNKLAHIGYAEKTDNVQIYTFYMPTEAISGKYDILVSYCDGEHSFANVYSKTFNFEKPQEKIRILSTPKNINYQEITIENFGMAQSFNLPIHNITDENLPVKIMLGLYDDDGNLISAISGDEKVVESNHTDKYTILLTDMQSSAVAVKVFIWETNSDIKPLTDAYIIKD